MVADTNNLDQALDSDTVPDTTQTHSKSSTTCGRRIGQIAALSLLLLAHALPARAGLIVDTGQPVDWPDPEGDPILSAQQWLAGRFNVNAHTVVTAASAYLSAGPSGGIVNFTLYATAGGMNELFTVPVPIPDVSFDRVGNAIPAWYGPSSVAWAIEPGEYWLALEVRSGSAFEGFVATRAPFPLACDGDSSASTVYGCDGLGLPIRVEAAAAVPEASSLLLLLSGLLGLHLLPQRRRAVHA